MKEGEKYAGAMLFCNKCSPCSPQSLYGGERAACIHKRAGNE